MDIYLSHLLIFGFLFLLPFERFWFGGIWKVCAYSLEVLDLYLAINVLHYHSSKKLEL